MANTTTNRVPVDIKDVVYNTGVRMGGVKEWNFVFDQFRITEVESERKKFIIALGASEDKAILTEYLNKTIYRNESGIRVQDCVDIYTAITASNVGRDAAMNWLEMYWEDIKDSFGAGSNFLGGGTAGTVVALVVDGFSTGANSDEDVERIYKFYINHVTDMQYVAGIFDASLEKANLNKAWVNNNYQEIVDWLDENAKSSAEKSGLALFVFLTLLISQNFL